MGPGRDPTGFARVGAVDGLAALAGLAPRQVVLTVGPQATDLALATKVSVPTASVIALLPDRAAVTRARSRVDRLGLVIRFDQATSTAQPYGKDTFDRILLVADPGDPGLAARSEGLVSWLRVDGWLHLLVTRAEAPCLRKELTGRPVVAGIMGWIGDWAHLPLARRGDHRPLSTTVVDADKDLA